MNYISHLTAFYDRVLQDSRITPTHISLYMALFQFWNVQHFRKSFMINRSEVMDVSKIRSVATYHKCMKELNLFGYIIYEPSYNPFAGSSVTMAKTYSQSDTDAEHVTKDVTMSDLKSEHPNERYHSDTPSNIELQNEPYTNLKNNTNNKPIVVGHTSPSNFEQVINFEGSAAGKEKLREKKENIVAAEKSAKLIYPAPEFVKPSISEVRMYFAEKEELTEEAEKFYNHYESNGWLVGGRAKMKNWQAAARNWILNTKKFQANSGIYQSRIRPEPRHLNASTGKSYQGKL